MFRRCGTLGVVKLEEACNLFVRALHWVTNHHTSMCRTGVWDWTLHSFAVGKVEHSYFRAALIGLDDWSPVLCTQAIEVQTRFHKALNCVAEGGSYSYTHEHSSPSNGKYHIITKTTSITTRLEMSPKILNQDFSGLANTHTHTQIFLTTIYFCRYNNKLFCKTIKTVELPG